MACPFFLPASPVAGFSDLYNGECAGSNGSPIPADLLRGCCNNGYARNTCVHAAASESDAFRFFIKSHSGGVVDVAWSSERNHHPVAVGNLLVRMNAAGNTPLEKQAHSIAAAYLRQIGVNN